MLSWLILGWLGLGFAGMICTLLFSIKYDGKVYFYNYKDVFTLCYMTLTGPTILFVACWLAYKEEKSLD